MIVASFRMEAQTYERVVSLAPSITQSLHYLEAQDKLVGKTSYCLPDGDNATVVATAVKLNIEKIVALKPDLILVLGLTDAKDIETLRKFDIKVEIFKSPQSFKEICNQFINLGKIVNKEQRAKEIVKESQEKIAHIQKNNRKGKGAKMFFQLGSDPLFTVLPRTFMDDFITLLGGENIANRLSKGIIGREYVVAKNPKYIFVCTMDIDDGKEAQQWERYSSIEAVKQKNIFTIDADLACQPTPITFVETLEIMSRAINKLK